MSMGEAEVKENEERRADESSVDVSCMVNVGCL